MKRLRSLAWNLPHSKILKIQCLAIFLKLFKVDRSQLAPWKIMKCTVIGARYVTALRQLAELTCRTSWYSVCPPIVVLVAGYMSRPSPFNPSDCSYLQHFLRFSFHVLLSSWFLIDILYFNLILNIDRNIECWATRSLFVISSSDVQVWAPYVEAGFDIFCIFQSFFDLTSVSLFLMLNLIDFEIRFSSYVSFTGLYFLFFFFFSLFHQEYELSFHTEVRGHFPTLFIRLHSYGNLWTCSLAAPIGSKWTLFYFVNIVIFAVKVSMPGGQIF